MRAGQPRYDPKMTLLLLALAGCDTDCTPITAIAISDPDGLLDASEMATLHEARDVFAAAVPVESVCVDEIRVTTDLTARGHDIMGRYSDSRNLVLLDIAYSDELAETLTHELCHALDAELGISAAHPELFADAEGQEELNEELYPTPESRAGERFARLCEDGPTHPGLTAALDALGLADPRDVLLLDEVYSAFEDAAITIGPSLEWGEPVALAPPAKDAPLVGSMVTGGRLMGVAIGDDPLAAHILEADPTGPSWGAEARLPRGSGSFVFATSLGDTDPFLLTDWHGEAPAVYRWSGGEPAPVDEALTTALGGGTVMFSFDDDRVWLRDFYGEGGLQVADVSTGKVQTYEPSTEVGLIPPDVRLPEGPAGRVSGGRWSTATRQVYTDDGLQPVEVPYQASLIGTLADGTVVASATPRLDGVGTCTTLVLRDPSGEWWLPGDTGCDAGTPSVLDGALYRVDGATGTVILTPAGGP